MLYEVITPWAEVDMGTTQQHAITRFSAPPQADAGSVPLLAGRTLALLMRPGLQLQCNLHVLVQTADAAAARGVRRQEFRRLTTSGATHIEPEFGALPRVETGLGHEIKSQDICLAFLYA